MKRAILGAILAATIAPASAQALDFAEPVQPTHQKTLIYCGGLSEADCWLSCPKWLKWSGIWNQVNYIDVVKTSIGYVCVVSHN